MKRAAESLRIFMSQNRVESQTRDFISIDQKKFLRVARFQTIIGRENERFHGVTILIIIVHCAGNEVREEDSGRANGGSKKSKDFFH